MSLLDYLRKTGPNGAVAGCLRRLYDAEAKHTRDPGETAPSLGSFANSYRMQGEQIVAVDYYWRLNDGFYGQWCIMYLAFRDLATFDVTDVRRLVPGRYRWLATALVLTDGHSGHVPLALQGYWRDPIRLAADMQNEADNDAVIQDITNFVVAAVLAIDGYLSGHLDVRDEGLAPAGPRQSSSAAEAIQFEGRQKLLHHAVAARIQRARFVQSATNEEVLEKLREEACGRAHKPIVCSGRPGTGKSSVLHANIR